jgi:lipopolysaccharide heptosyltransferase III
MRGCAAVPEGLGLPELIALVAGAAIFVGNDSGPAHVAAATARPCVAIYGSTNPEQWRPWRTEHRVVATGAKFRAIRGDKTIAVSQPRSIQEIGVDEVRAACEELLSAVPVKTAGS